MINFMAQTVLITTPEMFVLQVRDRWTFRTITVTLVFIIFSDVRISKAGTIYSHREVFHLMLYYIYNNILSPVFVLFYALISTVPIYL